jgi:hypothetical protein
MDDSSFHDFLDAARSASELRRRRSSVAAAPSSPEPMFFSSVSGHSEIH